MAGAKKRVLIYRLGSMGDTVVSLPAFHLIARAYPEADRRLLTNRPVNDKAAAAAAILESTGLVSGYFDYEVGIRGLAPLGRLWWRLLRWRPEVVVYVGSARGVKAAKRDAWFFRACGVFEQVGVPVTEDMQENRWEVERGAEEYECARLVRNLAVLGAGDAMEWVSEDRNWELRFTEAERAKAATVLAPAEGRPVIAMSLGTKVTQNNWGTEKWRSLLRALGRRYPECALAITGVPSESAESEEAAEGWRESVGAGAVVVNLCGKLTPRESAAVFERARVFLGHDSGPMHLADAVGTPAVVVFSARRRPTRWFPHGRQHHVIYHKVDCHGCGMVACTVEQMKCVRSITVDEVLAATGAAMEGRAAAEPAVWRFDMDVTRDGIVSATGTGTAREIAHAS